MVLEMAFPQLERAINPTHDIKLFAGRSNPKLAQEIADYLGTTVGPMVIKNFADGEIYVQVKESVRGDDVFIIQPLCNPVNENLMELLIIIDAFKRASAKSITAVIPYYGYARQDRKTSGREAITAKLVADLLTTAGANRVLAMDLHTGQIQGFFNILVDHIYATPILVNYINSLNINSDDMVAVSPDTGGVQRTRYFAKQIGCSLAIIDKRRPKPNVAEAMNLIGDVDGKTAIIIDDMVDTAGTLTAGIKMLKDKGAKAVYASCSHGILSGPAIDRLKAAELAGFVCTNTIDQAENQKVYPEMTVLSMAPLLAGLIHAVEENSSLSEVLAHAFDD